jgi:antitoxin component of MazEF toxin-antitoxin module
LFVKGLYKNGNSIKVYLPKMYLDALNLKEGNDVLVYLEKGKIVLEPYTMEWRKKLIRESNQAEGVTIK